MESVRSVHGCVRGRGLRGHFGRLELTWDLLDIRQHTARGPMVQR